MPDRGRCSVVRMKFELETLFIEEACRTSALATRVIAAAPDAAFRCATSRMAASPRGRADVADPFGAGKRRMVIMRRRRPFLMACPAGSAEVRLLRIPGADARVELPDGLQLLLSAGIRRR